MYRLHERLVAIRTEYNLRLKSGVTVTTVPAAAAVGGQQQQRPRAEAEEAPLRYLQDLLAWVEENQRRLAAAEWGMDLPTVEAQLGGHRGLHHSIEEFRAKIERARADEVRCPPRQGGVRPPSPRGPGLGVTPRSGTGVPALTACVPPTQAQLAPGPRGAYRECLGKLDLQYGKLLVRGRRGWGVRGEELRDVGRCVGRGMWGEMCGVEDVGGDVGGGWCRTWGDV